ncbi:unnamed protein product [Diabrotica balteata]|uniref:Uncharacterized protein n=1 Tax=Diabrotica balteata TaxID=107213 RepID=A0A9N9SUM1_DIABA|nr:unnamed protein product [Diabrotica balteata]
MRTKKRRVVKIDYPPLTTRKWIPPEERPKRRKKPPAYIKPEGIDQKLKISSLRKIWHQFVYYDKTAILLGHYGQTAKKYYDKTRGLQGSCNCAVACVFAYLFPMDTWNSSTIDRILDIGDNLYVKSIQQDPDRCLIYVTTNKIHPSIFLDRDKITFDIDCKNRIEEKFHSAAEDKIKETLNEAVQKFFKQYPSGIITLLGKYLAVWIQDHAYYLFDPTEHTEDGYPAYGLQCHVASLEQNYPRYPLKGEGFAVVYRCLTLDDLISKLYLNLNVHIPCATFTLEGCTVQRFIHLDLCPPSRLEEVELIKTEMTSLPQGPLQEQKKTELGRDVTTENLRKYFDELQDECWGDTLQIMELAPEAGDTLSLSKRPSWLQEPYLKADVCKFPIPFKARTDVVSFYVDIEPDGSKSIIRAGTHHADPSFSKYKGRQSMGNAISALTMLKFHKSKHWVPSLLNKILKHGDLLYRDAMITISRSQELKLSNFQKKTEYLDKVFMPKIEDFVVIGRLTSNDFEVLDLLTALESFLIDHICCVIIGILQDMWILRGNFSQSDRKFDLISRNFQSPAICFALLTTIKSISLKDFLKETIDEILDTGDDFYKQSVQTLSEKEQFNNRMLMLTEINKNFKWKDKMVDFDVEECVSNGLFNCKDTNFNKAINNYFNNFDSGIITCRSMSVVLWKSEDKFYYFDSHNRNEKGLATPYGTACILRASQLDSLIEVLLANFAPTPENFYNIHNVKVTFSEMDDDELIRPVMEFYKRLGANKLILRSLYSEISNKYDLNVGKQTVPMCVMAIGFNRLKPSIEWNQQDIDEILNKGDALYTDCISDILKEEEIKHLTQIRTGNVLPLDQTTANEVIENGEEEVATPEEDAKKGNDLTKLDEESKPETTDLEGSVKEGDEEEEDEHAPIQITLDNMKKEFNIGLNKFDLVVETEAEGYVIGYEDWSELRLPKPKKPKRHRKMRSRRQQKLHHEVEGDDVVQSVTNYETLAEKGEGDYTMMDYLGEGGEEEELLSEEESEIQYPPMIHRGSDFWREKEKSGRACVLAFNKFDDMVNHIYTNIPPKLIPETKFELKTVKLTNNNDVRQRFNTECERTDVYSGNWYFFEEIDKGMWILRGTMTITNEMFPQQNRGKQQLTTTIAALAVAFIFCVVCYNDTSVDSILKYGDKLFTFIKNYRKKQLKQLTCECENTRNKLCDEDIGWLIQNEEVTLNDIPKKFCISRFMVIINIEPDVVVGDVNAQDFEDINDVKRGLRKFFENHQFGVLQAKGLTVAIWRGARMYYMFDGLNRGRNGIVAPYGTACVTRFLDIDKLADVFLANLPKYGNNCFFIHNVTMEKDICPRAREPKFVIPPQNTVALGGFQEVAAGKSIVRGSLTQNDQKFEKIQNAMSAPVAIIALAMTLLHKTNTWSKPILDEIIELGSELYDETMEFLGLDFNPWEEKLDVARVNTHFNIGVIKASCVVRLTEIRGIIDINDPCTLSLRKGLEKFFKKNSHGILVSEPYTVAIWEEYNEDNRQIIYMFDPNSRDAAGKPAIGGTACLISFFNSDMVNEHILKNILEPEQTTCTFEIIPVEIIVGTMRIPRKTEHIRSEYLPITSTRCTEVAEDKKLLRKYAEHERRKREAKCRQQLGRKDYYITKTGDALLRGYRSQNSQCFNDACRNNQDIPNCIVALVMNHLVSVERWTFKNIDLILVTGNQLYVDSYIAYGPKDLKLGMENIVRKFYLQHLTIHVTIYKPILSNVFTEECLSKTLSVFFTQEQHCILNHQNQWVALFFKSVKPEDQIFLEAMDNLITDDKVIDINIFKYIIRQKDTLIKELYGKIDLMSQHIDLLKQLNSQKNVVENQEQLIHQNKVINKDTLMDSVETKSVRQPINANKDRTVASSSQKCEVTKKDVSEAILQVTTEQKLNEYIYIGESNQEKSEWTEVDRRKKRKHLVVGKNTEMILNGKEIKGVHKLIDLHVYRIDPDMTAENMRELMKTTFPEVEVESLKSKHPDIYSSFKVTIFNNNFKEAMSPKIWPCQFYMFDPHERDLEGYPIGQDCCGCGAAILMRFNDVDRLVYRLISNLTPKHVEIQELNHEAEESENEDKSLFTLWLASIEIK